MRKNNSESIGDVLNAYLKSLKMDDKVHEARLLGSWEEIVGKGIASHTNRISVSRHTLYIQVDSAALKQELFYNRAKLIKLINDHLGTTFITQIMVK